MAKKATIPELSRIIQRRVRAGIDEMARFGAKEYREDVIQNTEPGFPTGPFKGPHSSQGEFPYRETGQGADNVDWEPGKRTGNISAAYGVRGPSTGVGPYPPTHEEPGGMHLIELMQAERLGPDRTFFNNLQGFRRIFRKFARA